MTKLPISSTLVQCLAIFGLHFGKLLRWAFIPLCLGLGAIGLVVGLAVLADGMNKGAFLWAIPALVAGLFALLATMPLSIRINQLAVLGVIEDQGYLGMIFSGRSLRFFGYWILVNLIIGGGLLVAATPAIIVAGGGLSPEPAGSMMAAAIGVSVVLGVAFLILTAPFNLVYPAAAIEDEPSLMASYHLGSGNKWRLSVCLFLVMLLFSGLSQLLEWMPDLFDEEHQQAMRIILLPVQFFVLFFNYVATTALPGVAYRVLSGLPEPGDGGDAGPANKEKSGV